MSDGPVAGTFCSFIRFLVSLHCRVSLTRISEVTDMEMVIFHVCDIHAEDQDAQ